MTAHYTRDIVPSWCRKRRPRAVRPGCKHARIDDLVTHGRYSLSLHHLCSPSLEEKSVFRCCIVRPTYAGRRATAREGHRGDVQKKDCQHRGDSFFETFQRNIRVLTCVFAPKMPNGFSRRARVLLSRLHHHTNHPLPPLLCSPPCTNRSPHIS